MTWAGRGEDRWVYTGDEERHLLLKAGTRYVELHGSTAHVFDGPAEVADPDLPLDFTHAGNAWVLTGDVNAAGEDEAWDAMVKYAGLRKEPDGQVD
ncbi:hypothetical protein AB0M54_24275 [Actinoplanes sp. NPDC051470]|uniref:hypothetical protein n=1 Tax=Actinoplanes sp. NPDC051470 TaxID=3157224 RepID=UPI003439BE8D